MLALERAGILVDTYYASEIEPNAIKISRKNYPNIVQLGDVTKWRDWDIDWSSIDLLIGGSPCQGFSFAGKQLNFEDPRSKLFFVYADILEHIYKMNPNIKFLLENVKMAKEYQDVITSYLHVCPVNIDSIVMTPMRRNRLYWFNWDYDTINTKATNKMLIDILDEQVQDGLFLSQERFNKLTYIENGVLFVKSLSKSPIKIDCGDGIVLSRTWQTYMPIVRKASHCIRSANPNDVGVVVSHNGKITARKFTLFEMERMQTLPRGYTSNSEVSELNAKKCIGNGWTVDVIADILHNIKN